MSNYLVQANAKVACLHSGPAQPSLPNPRVAVGGKATVFMSSPYAVSGCTMPAPPNGNGPCVTGQWQTGTTRVASGGKPLVVSTGSSSCTPTGTPLVVSSTQTRVIAS